MYHYSNIRIKLLGYPKLDHFSIEIHAPCCETHIYIYLYTVHICICIIIYIHIYIYTYLYIYIHIYIIIYLHICRHLLLIAEIHRFECGALPFAMTSPPKGGHRVAHERPHADADGKAEVKLDGQLRSILQRRTVIDLCPVDRPFSPWKNRRCEVTVGFWVTVDVCHEKLTLV